MDSNLKFFVEVNKNIVKKATYNNLERVHREIQTKSYKILYQKNNKRNVINFVQNFKYIR